MCFRGSSASIETVLFSTAAESPAGSIARLRR